MQFNIHEAKTQFSMVVAAVERGETVTICRNGRPVIDCVPAKPAGAFPFGAWGRLAPRRVVAGPHGRPHRWRNAGRHGALMLLDTHVLVWALLAPDLLSGTARDALAATPERCVSAAGLYEITYKAMLGTVARGRGPAPGRSGRPPPGGRVRRRRGVRRGSGTGRTLRVGAPGSVRPDHRRHRPGPRAAGRLEGPHARRRPGRSAADLVGGGPSPSRAPNGTPR